MKNIIKIFIFITILFEVNIGNAEIFIATTSTDNCNVCNGNAILNTDTPGSITYNWFSIDDVNLLTETNSLGNSILPNLCAGLYYVVTSYPNNIDSTTFFNVDTDITENFTLSEIITCSTSSINLNDYITLGVNTTGVWTMPNNLVFDGILVGDTDNPILSGVYQYTLPEGACSVSTGVNLISNQPANPGLSTTYLICENYPPFLMTDFLSGDPDYGGIWFDSNNSPTDEIFYTDTQDTELFTYFIDTVEGCSPVFSTLYIIKNVLPNSGLSGEITICETASPLDLFPLVDGNPDTSGIWFNENFQNISMPYTPTSNAAGIYTYMVAGDVPCPSTQSELTINYTSGVYSGEGNDITLCESLNNYNLFESLSGTISQGGIWTNQNNEISDSLIGISTLNNGEYTYSVSLAGCADASSTVLFSVENTINAGSDTTIFLCETQDNYNLFDALSADANNNGIWSEDNLVISSIYENINTGFHEFIYQTNNIACAQDEAVITLQVDPSIYAGSDTSVVICQTNSDFLLSDYLNNQSNDLGSWLFNNVEVNELFSPLNSSGGEYIYELNPENACPLSQATISITVIDSITFSGGQFIEECNYNQEISIGESNETSCTYQWSPQTYLSEDDVSNPTIDLSLISSPINLIYTIAINNEACQKTIEREITIHEPPIINMDSIYSDCEGEIITLYSGIYDEVFWSPANVFSNPENPLQNLTLSETSTIELSVTNSNNCSASNEIELIVFPRPDITFEINSHIHCTPATVEIANTSFNNIPTAYYWNFSNDYITSEQTVIQNFNEPTSFNFSLYAVSDNGCTNIINHEQNIVVFQTPNASFSYTAENLSVFNNQIQLNNLSHFAQEYEWKMNDNFFSVEESPDVLLPQIAGQNNLICLEVFNNGCVDSTCLNIFIPEVQNIYVPNTFTPNDDQLNDVFKPILLKDNILEYSLIIYNRWGEVVFETKDINEGWIGDTKKNSSYYAKDGSYIWQLKIKEKDIRGEQIFKGKVTLIR